MYANVGTQLATAKCIPSAIAFLFANRPACNVKFTSPTKLDSFIASASVV